MSKMPHRGVSGRLSQSDARATLVISRELVNHGPRTLRRLAKEELVLHEALVKTMAKLDQAGPEAVAEMAGAASKLAGALDVTRERRRVLLGIPAPGRKKEEPAKTYDVQPAEPIDWPVDHDAEERVHGEVPARW